MLNYKVGNFPLTYLDFLFADRKLSISDWEGLVGTEGHCVDRWECRFSSSAARLILTNASLSSVPIYCMGRFLLVDGTHDGFEKHLARFFWEGVGDTRKISLVKMG
jgi:hypothetical protein